MFMIMMDLKFRVKSSKQERAYIRTDLFFFFKLKLCPQTSKVVCAAHKVNPNIAFGIFWESVFFLFIGLHPMIVAVL
jgi:hypothetical protein